jgi:hypothetical protein
MGAADQPKNQQAVALGQLGGAARAAALSPRRRREIARRGAEARWARLPELLRPLLWEHAVDEFRLPDKQDIVLLHVLAYGTPEQVDWARRRFGDRKIEAWLRQRRGWGIPGVEHGRVRRWIAPSEVSEWWSEDPRARAWAEQRLLTGRDAPEAVRRLLKTYHPAALLWADPDARYTIVREILVRGDAGARAWLEGVMDRQEARALVADYRGTGCSEPEREKLRREFGFTTDEMPVRPFTETEWP